MTVKRGAVVRPALTGERHQVVVDHVQPRALPREQLNREEHKRHTTGGTPSPGRSLTPDPRTRVDIDFGCGYLLHRGFVQLVEIQRVDAVLCSEDEVLIWREETEQGETPAPAKHVCSVCLCSDHMKPDLWCPDESTMWHS